MRTTVTKNTFKEFALLLNGKGNFIFMTIITFNEINIIPSIEEKYDFENKTLL
ncbi:hypothetical protein SKA34_12435 [Photobacterium sp. SKA34]|nr:hypothetical protein SKA34_12435 [Photobacterium sp. SKA34]